jgi:hypothetical protein
MTLRSSLTRHDDELAITVDARMNLEIEIDHDHGDDRLVPMIEEEHAAELPPDAAEARVRYRCPDCGHRVSLRARAGSESPALALGGPTTDGSSD